MKKVRKGMQVTLWIPDELKDLYDKAKNKISVSMLLQQALNDWANTGRSSDQLLGENKTMRRKLRQIRALSKLEYRGNEQEEEKARG